MLDKNISNKKIFFISLLIFISASPLFENVEKIIYSCLVFFFILLFNKEKLKFNIYNIIIISYFCFIYLIYSPLVDLFRGGPIDFLSGVGFFVLTLISFVCCSLFSRDEILRVNELFVRYTIVIGLPLWMIIINSYWMVDSLPSYTFGNSSHHTLFFVNFLVIDGVLTSRFTGFGREPGLVQFFYLLALCYRLKLSSGDIDIYSLLIILAIFLGRSTAGLFTMLFIIFLCLPRKKAIKYIILFSPLIVFFAVDELIFHIDNKLIGADSFAFRYERYLDFFSSDILNILFGYGSGYYSHFIVPLGIGGWDTLLQYSQRYGIISFVLLCVIVICSNIGFPFLSVILLLAFISQSLWFYPAVSFFYFKFHEKN